MPGSSQRNADLGFALIPARDTLIARLLDRRVVTTEQIAQWTAQARTLIDVESAQNQLQRLNFTPDRIEAQTMRWVTENARRASADDATISWDITERIARVHADLHALPGKTNGVPNPQCRIWP
jgi:hypothetical protein